MNPSHLFERLRQEYVPPLPKSLCNLRELRIEKAPLKIASNEIRQLFPHTANQQGLSEERQVAGLRVGVLFSGGQAPGGHNVIAGLFDAIKELHPEGHLIGFLGGPKGILLNKTREIEEALLFPFRNQGGFDLLGSGRDKIESEVQFQQAKETALSHSLNGLVIVGGDDSNTNAAFLSEYFQKEQILCSVIGVPKTIDGDLRGEGIELPFGFDTATKVYSEEISNVAKDSLSNNKYYYFIKLMGRSASHIALECALQTHPNLTLIGEEIEKEQKTIEDLVKEIAELVIERSRLGKRGGVILIPEGVIEFFHALSPAIQQHLSLEKDPHGNINLAKIETERLIMALVGEELEKSKNYQEKFNAVPLYFGYEGRSAFPSNFDCQYSYALGRLSAAMIFQKMTGYMAAIKNLHLPTKEWEPLAIPLLSLMHLEKRNDQLKAVIRKALVNIEGPVFQTFAAFREKWKWEDSYQFVGPQQFFGPLELTQSKNLTLLIESQVPF